MIHKPLAFRFTAEIPPPVAGDRASDADRLIQELERLDFSSVSIPLHVLTRLSEELRKNRFILSVVMGVDRKGWRLLDIGGVGVYGIACDIGTTNISCSLFDLEKGQKIGFHDMENPQIRFGSDVLSRVQRSMLGESAELHEMLLDGINNLIHELCSGNCIDREAVYAVTVAGNTIMSHFFLGLDVRNIPVSPYTPAVSSQMLVSADEAGLNINKRAVVFVFPNAGSYVGGDVISGILYSGIHREEEPALFIDVGTNAEITLGCSDWLMVGAGAAGPALEGGVASIGKKAETGAVSHVEIDPATGKVTMDIIGHGEPEGLCGSGMIDLVSELYSAGILDQSGKFRNSGKRIVERDGDRGFLVYESGSRELILTEREIQNFLRSKAAMFAFLSVFVKSVGLRLRELGKISVAGALGCGINLDNAVKIGMLPDLPRERYIQLGNSSLGGSEMLLVDRTLMADVENIRERITYRQMAEDTELLNALQGALFIPHTNPETLKG